MTSTKRNGTSGSRTPKNESSLSADALADCRTFARLYKQKKRSTRNSEEPTLNYARLETLTGISQNTWGAMALGKRALHAKAMIAVERHYGFPKENFKRWKAVAAEWEVAAAATSSTAGAIATAVAELPASERIALLASLDQLMKAPKKRRAKIIETMRRMLGASGRITLAKASTG